MFTLKTCWGGGPALLLPMCTRAIQYIVIILWSDYLRVHPAKRTHEGTCPALVDLCVWIARKLRRNVPCEPRAD